jgi:hypothetical protein
MNTSTTDPRFDVELPLLPETRDPDHVATLVEAFLRHIERLDDQSRRVDRGDVIQALSITAAIQWARRDAERRHGPLRMRLEGLEVAAAPPAPRRAAA